MSANPNEQGNTLNPGNEEAFQLLKENCQNFLKMSQEEKSEGIKINYLLGLIQLCDNLKIDPNTFITTIFEEILFKDLSILKNRNLLSNFISVLESKKNNELFEKYFFSLLTTFGKDYNVNSIYFHQYLIDISLYYIFNSSFKCEEKTNYISMIIENDIKPFETQLLKNIINKNKKLIDDNENKTTMVKCLYNKFISMDKYKSCLILFSKILENVNNNYRKIPKDIIFEMIKSTNNFGFNHVIKKTKEINDFLIFNYLLLDNLDEKLFVSEEELEFLDIYLINILNLLSLKKDLNIEIFQKIYTYYNTQKFKNLNKVFVDSLYYLSTYSYSNSQYEFLFNCLNSPNINPIYNKIITNHLLSLNKRPLNYKENTINKSIKFVIDDDLNKEALIDENLIFIFESNSSANNNTLFLNHLNLYSYIINSSFSVCQGSRFTMSINFYPKVLNRIFTLLTYLSLENSNKKKIFEELLLFLLDLFNIIIGFYISDDKNIFNEDYLIISFLKILEKSSVDNKYAIIFPSFINTIKSYLVSTYDQLVDSSNNNKLYNLIFDFIISTYSYNDNSNGINNSQENIILFKSLILIFFDKTCATNKKNFFALDKLIDLVLKCNNPSVKIFESFYKLCDDLQRSPEEMNKHLSNYCLNKFSKNCSSNNFAVESLIDYITEKFNEMFMKNRPNNIQYNENTYFIINTVSNLYTNKKLRKETGTIMNNLIEKIDDFCGNKLIIGVIDYLFISIENNECDIKSIIENEKDIFSKYNKLKKALDKLDYYTCIYDNYFDNNIQNNKASMCHYGILKSLAHLLSGYLSNYINSTSTDESKLSKEESIIQLKKQEKIINIFEYIKNKILFNQSLQNTSYPVLFINYIFSDKNVLHYFMVHHTNYVVKKYLDNNTPDIAAESAKATINEMADKNIIIADYIKKAPYYILFMKDIINSYIEFDSTMLNPNKYNYLRSNQSVANLNIVNNLKEKGDLIFSKYSEYQQSMLNSFFTKIFLDQIYEKGNDIKTLENNQIIFLFLLDNSLLEMYFDLFGYFVNVDYTLIQLYAIARKKNVPIELNEKYISFIYKYIENDKFSNFISKILKNKKTFDNLFKCHNINNKYIEDLYGILENVMNNLSKNDSNCIQIVQIFNQILDNINHFYHINPNFANMQLYLCGKIIKSVMKNIKLYDNKSGNISSVENSNSNVNDTPQNDSFLEGIYSSILPNYVNIVYNAINSVFNTKDNKIGLDYSLDNLYLSFNLVIDFISDANANKNNYYESLVNRMDSNAFKFFLELLSFNKYNDYPVNNNFSSFFIKRYEELSGDNVYKKFLDNLFLFALFRGKLDEKNLKSVIIELFGDFKDNQKNQNFKRLGYLACYVLNSTRKDNNNTMNKSNNETLMFYGDYSIVSSIGERFKEDEKSLSKKTPNQSNFK